MSEIDVTAPTIDLYIREVTHVDGSCEYRYVPPTEDLRTDRNYEAVVTITDNTEISESGANELAEGSRIEVFDPAVLENVTEVAAGQMLRGTNYVHFTLGGLNQGYIRFNVVAIDTAGNESSTFVLRYVTDDSEDSTSIAKIDPAVEDEQIDQVFEVRGRSYYHGISHIVGDQDYYDTGTYELRLYSTVDTDDYVILASGAADVDSDEYRVLGTIDPTLYPSGLYRLVLNTYCCCCGCSEATGRHYKAIDERIIEIFNDGRPTDLTLSFTDLDVDLGGIPVSLTRTYSSANVEADGSLVDCHFGPGWTLNLLEAGVQIAQPSRPTASKDDPLTEGSRVLVRLPDGTIERFHVRADEDLGLQRVVLAAFRSRRRHFKHARGGRTRRRSGAEAIRRGPWRGLFRRIEYETRRTFRGRTARRLYSAHSPASTIFMTSAPVPWRQSRTTVRTASRSAGRKIPIPILVPTRICIAQPVLKSWLRRRAPILMPPTPGIVSPTVFIRFNTDGTIAAIVDPRGSAVTLHVRYRTPGFRYRPW